MSDKTREQLPDRQAMRRVVLERAGWQCEARVLVPEVQCAGALEVDERTPRGVRPGAHLDVDEGQALCQAHHRWKTAEPEKAHARGLRAWSWE